FHERPVRRCSSKTENGSGLAARISRSAILAGDESYASRRSPVGRRGMEKIGRSECGRISDHPHDDFGAKSTLTDSQRTRRPDEARCFSPHLDSYCKSRKPLAKPFLLPAHREWRSRIRYLEDNHSSDESGIVMYGQWHDLFKYG